MRFKNTFFKAEIRSIRMKRQNSFFFRIGLDITLDDKQQFKVLIDLIYIGNSVSYKTDSKVVWNYEQLVNDIFSYAKPFKYHNYIS